MDNLLRMEEAKKIAKDLNDKYQLDKVSEMIKDNMITFFHKEKEYRVRLLHQVEKDELDLFRRRKFGELLQDKNILFSAELIRLYKEKGIDIEKDIGDKIKKILNEIKDKNLKLGESLEKKEPESILKIYYDDIIELKNEVDGLITQKSSLLENSFEKTLENQVIKYLSYLSLEIKENEEFIKAYKKVDEFLKADDELIGKCITYTMAINYRI